MKKIFLILVVLCTTIMGFAQVQLFHGIKSGMTPEQFKAAWESDTSILYKISIEDGKQVKEPLTYIGNYAYFIEPHYNENNKLKFILFNSTKRYTRNKYTSELKIQALEIYDILEGMYNKPIYDDWQEWYEIPLNIGEIIVEYDTGIHGAAILISNQSGVFYLYFIVSDVKMLKNK